MAWLAKKDYKHALADFETAAIQYVLGVKDGELTDTGDFNEQRFRGELLNSLRSGEWEEFDKTHLKNMHVQLLYEYDKKIKFCRMMLHADDHQILSEVFAQSSSELRNR